MESLRLTPPYDDSMFSGGMIVLSVTASSWVGTGGTTGVGVAVRPFAKSMRRASPGKPSVISWTMIWDGRRSARTPGGSSPLLEERVGSLVAWASSVRRNQCLKKIMTTT